jgi:hypothetical protein
MSESECELEALVVLVVSAYLGYVSLRLSLMDNERTLSQALQRFSRLEVIR